MKRNWILAFILTAIAGTGLHFLYDLLPVPLIGLFVPVNESPWEHLKLIYWPFLIAGLFLSAKAEDCAAVLGGFFTAVLAMVWGLLGTYYLLTAGFLVEALWVDIVLYYLTLLGGFWLAWHVSKGKSAAVLGSWLLLPVCFLGVCLLLFSLEAPALPVFVSPT